MWMWNQDLTTITLAVRLTPVYLKGNLNIQLNFFDIAMAVLKAF